MHSTIPSTCMLSMFSVWRMIVGTGTERQDAFPLSRSLQSSDFLACETRRNGSSIIHASKTSLYRVALSDGGEQGTCERKQSVDHDYCCHLPGACARWLCGHADMTHPTHAFLSRLCCQGSLQNTIKMCVKKKSLSQTEIIPAGGGETRGDNPEQDVHTQKEHENEHVCTQREHFNM